MGWVTVFMVGLAALFDLLFWVEYVALGGYSGNPDQKVGTSQQITGGAGQTLSVEHLARRRTPSQGYAQVNHNGPTLTSAKGVVGVQRSARVAGLCCFDVSFTPRVAVASGHIDDYATVGTILGSNVPSVCDAPYRDAAAKTYAASTSAPRNDLSFDIVFLR